MEEILRIRVKPNSRVPRIGGAHDGRLVIAVAEPPEDGKATEAVRSVLAKALGVRAGDLHLVRGAVSRDKDFQLNRPMTAEIWSIFEEYRGH